MKNILYIDPSPKGLDGPYQNKEFHQAKLRLFAKYFPKCITLFQSSSKSPSIKSKLKRTKKILNFQPLNPSHHDPYWRSLLSNKIKTIKTLTNSSHSPHQLAPKIKLFSQLSTIKLSMYNFRSHLHQISTTMKRLKSLRHLEITYISKDQKDFINDLNSSPRLLASLKTFKISCSWEAGHDFQLLELLQSKKTLLYYLTSLELNTLWSPSHLQHFKNLAGSCPNLRGLSLETSCRDLNPDEYDRSRFSYQCFQVDINYLETIKTFQNLQSLHLDIADTFTFLKDFALPPSVICLKINFEECLSKKIMLKIDSSFQDTDQNNDSQFSHIFENNPTLLNFYENFKNLPHLHTFNLLFSIDAMEEEYKYQSYLAREIFKRISSVKNLSLLASRTSPGLNYDLLSFLFESYFPKIFESFDRFAHTLEHLEIGQKNLVLKKHDFSASRNKFPKLSSIVIVGYFKGISQSSSERIQGLFEDMILLGDSIKHIKLRAE